MNFIRNLMMESGFYQVAVIVAVAELGCLLRSSALTTQYGRWPLFLGTIVGTAAAAAVGIFLGEIAQRFVSEAVLRWMAGLMLVAVGIWIIFFEHH